MSKTPEEEITLEELRTLRAAKAELEKIKQKEEDEKNAKKEKVRAWRCLNCGKDLGPADWDEKRLSRQHPDGCPRCGYTQADIS